MSVRGLHGGVGGLPGVRGFRVGLRGLHAGVRGGVRGRLRLRPVALLAVAALAVGLAVPLRVDAATVTFGTPTATSKFGDGVTFNQPISTSGSPARTEIVIDFPKALGPSVTDVPEASATSLTFKLDTSKGQLVPNTPLVAHWRVTFADGTEQNGPDVHVTYADDRFKWRTKSSQLITLHWYQGDDAFANRALQVGEAGVKKAAQLLGATETDPIDFYVYADQQSFYDALGPGTRESVAGEAHPEIRTLFALITPDQVNDPWVGTVVPHELTHVVYSDVVTNPYHFPPHWLNEGLAVYLTQGYDVGSRADIVNAVKAGTLMPLEALTGQFPTVPERFSLAYSEAVSAVDYLVRTYGQSALVTLIHTYATGAGDDDAFRAATGHPVADFYSAWLTANGVGSAATYGPRAAPTGPLPPGWGAAPAPAGSAAASGAAAAGTAATANTSGTGTTQGSTEVILVAAIIALAAVMGLIAVLLLRRGSEGRPPHQDRLW